MDWLREAIDRAGGQKTVAERSGISRSHLKNLYRGVRRLTPESANALRPLLDVAGETWMDALLSRPQVRTKRAHTSPADGEARP